MSKIVVKNVFKKFNYQVVLNDINLELTSGHIYGLAGINGSGKTVLMKCICGLSTPTQGCIEIDDKKIGKDIDFPESIAYLLRRQDL